MTVEATPADVELTTPLVSPDGAAVAAIDVYGVVDLFDASGRKPFGYQPPRDRFGNRDQLIQPRQTIRLLLGEAHDVAEVN